MLPGSRSDMRQRIEWAIVAALAVAAVAYVPAARAADVPVSEEARIHFAAGVALLRDPKAPRYDEAYREFKTAYAAAPSYKILGNLALCAMKVERDGEAIQAYELYLKEAGFELTSEEREQIERDILTLKTGNAKVTVSSDPPGATIQDVRLPNQGDEIRNSYGDVLTPLTLAVRHGHHVMRAHLSGYDDQEWEFDAMGDAMSPHVFAMQRPAPVRVDTLPQRERPLPLAAFITGGVAVALAAGGAVVGALALKKHSDFNSLNTGADPEGAQAARTDGERLNVVTDVLFGGALIAAGITTVLVLTRPTLERKGGAAPPPALAILPSGGAHWAGASASLHF
jgi:hypothetical protein